MGELSSKQTDPRLPTSRAPTEALDGVEPYGGTGRSRNDCANRRQCPCSILVACITVRRTASGWRNTLRWETRSLLRVCSKGGFISLALNTRDEGSKVSLTTVPPCPEYHHHPAALLRDVVGEVVRQFDLTVAERDIHLPTDRGDRTAYFTGSRQGGEPVFVKMIGTTNEDTQRLFRHEVEVTRALNGAAQSGFSVPRLLGHDQYREIDWMAMEHIEGSRVLLTGETFEPLVRALRAIREVPFALVTGHTSCGINHHPRGADWYEDHFLGTSARLAEQGYITAEQREIITGFSNRARPELHEERPNPLTSHGDFAPNNLRLRGQTIVVLDWEHSHRNYGPIDLAHYSTMSHVWESPLRGKFVRAVIDDWEFDEEVFLLAQLERLTGRANDTFCRRGKRDDATLTRLNGLTTSLKRFLP